MRWTPLFSKWALLILGLGWLLSPPLFAKRDPNEIPCDIAWDSLSGVSEYKIVMENIDGTKIPVRVLTGLPKRAINVSAAEKFWGLDPGQKTTFEAAFGPLHPDDLMVTVESNTGHFTLQSGGMKQEVTAPVFFPLNFRPNHALRDSYIIRSTERDPQVTEAIRDFARANEGRHFFEGCVGATRQSLLKAGILIPGSEPSILPQMSATVLKNLLKNGFVTVDGKEIPVEIYRTVEEPLSVTLTKIESVQKKQIPLRIAAGGTALSLLAGCSVGGVRYLVMTREPSDDDKEIEVTNTNRKEADESRVLKPKNN